MMLHWRIALVVVLGSVALAAQTADVPSFEVAAITANHDGGKKGVIRSLPGGRFTATNVTLRDLLEAAYPMEPPGSFAGAPGWVDVDRFDVVAKAPGNVDDKIRATVKGNGAKEKIGASSSAGASPEQLMIRALLQERFTLTLRRDTRDEPIYALAVVKPNGSPGAQLVRSTVDCRAAAGGKADKACGVKVGPGEVVARGTTMRELAAGLSQAVHRTVVDRTGLAGAFDAHLTWTPDQPTVDRKRPSSKRSLDPGGPSIFTAIQEQLGLKLDPGHGPAEVLVIDHVEHPSLD